MTQNQYDEILSLIKKGLPLDKACKRIGIKRSEYYRDATEEQKSEIKYHKTTTLKTAVPGHGSLPYDTRNLNFDLDY